MKMPCTLITTLLILCFATHRTARKLREWGRTLSRSSQLLLLILEGTFLRYSERLVNKRIAYCDRINTLLSSSDLSYIKTLLILYDVKVSVWIWFHSFGSRIPLSTPLLTPVMGEATNLSLSQEKANLVSCGLVKGMLSKYK